MRLLGVRQNPADGWKFPFSGLSDSFGRAAGVVCHHTGQQISYSYTRRPVQTHATSDNSVWFNCQLFVVTQSAALSHIVRQNPDQHPMLNMQASILEANSWPLFGRDITIDWFIPPTSTRVESSELLVYWFSLGTSFSAAALT